MVTPDYKEAYGASYPRPKDLKAIDIKADFGFEPNLFDIPDRFAPYVSRVLLPIGMLKDRWEKLADCILRDY